MKGLRFPHLNIRSCLPRLKALGLKCLTVIIDVLGLSETWFKHTITDNLVCINGYALERFDRTLNDRAKLGGGVCLYIKADLNYLPNKNLWVSTNDVEIICVTLLPDNARRILILNVYRPPKGNLSNALDSIRTITNAVDELLRMDCIVMGDFNVDLLWYSPSVETLKDFFFELDMQQIITTPTRCSPNRDTLIDHCYVRMAYPAERGTIDLELSDHMLIFVAKKKPLVKLEKTKYRGRDLRNFDPVVLYNKLQNHNWGRFYAIACPNRACEYLHSVILDVINVLCPLRTFITTASKPEWYNAEVVELSNNMHRLFRIGKRKGKDRLVAQARNYRNLLRTALGRCKRDYFSDQIVYYESNSKAFW